MEETPGPLQNLIQLSFRHIHLISVQQTSGASLVRIELSRVSPMAIFQQNLPASLRFRPPPPPENRGIPSTDRRPYLVTVPPRRSATPTRKTVPTASPYLALSPH